MKNQNQAPKKALPKSAKNQTESTGTNSRENPGLASYSSPKLWTGKPLEIVSPGRFQPSLNERQACGVIAIAIVTAKDDLERLCGTFLGDGLIAKASQLAETIAIASAVVRASVVASLALDNLTNNRAEIIPYSAPGLSGMSALTWEEAALEMVATLHGCAEDIRAHSFRDSFVYAELAEAVAIAEEIYSITGMATERGEGRGLSTENPTGMQREAWLARIGVATGQHESWRSGPGKGLHAICPPPHSTPHI